MYNCFESEVQRKVDCILSEPHKHWGNRQISQKIKDFLEYLRQAFYSATHCGTLHTKISQMSISQIYLTVRNTEISDSQVLLLSEPLRSANLFFFWVGIHSAYNQRESQTRKQNWINRAPLEL